MATVHLIRPKGSEVGFVVSKDESDKFVGVMGLLSAGERFLSFSGRSGKDDPSNLFSYRMEDGTNVIVNLTDDHFCDKYNGRILCEPIEMWESKGYIEHNGSMFKEMEEIVALQLRGDERDKFDQALNWSREIGYHLEGFGMKEHGTNWVLVNGHESDEIGRGDYVLLTESGAIEVHTKDSLIEEGYIIQDEL